MARRFDLHDASVDMLRIVLGLQTFRQERDRYPETLAELRATGWDVPQDRFSEDEFIYRREGEGFVLYSVGPNLVDDGGVPAGRFPFGRRDEYEPGDELRCDIVWEWAER